MIVKTAVNLFKYSVVETVMVVKIVMIVKTALIVVIVLGVKIYKMKNI